MRQTAARWNTRTYGRAISIGGQCRGSSSTARPRSSTDANSEKASPLARPFRLVGLVAATKVELRAPLAASRADLEREKEVAGRVPRVLAKEAGIPGTQAIGSHDAEIDGHDPAGVEEAEGSH